MGVKTAGTGHFQIPAAPAAGTSVTSGTANAYTTSAVQLIASTVAPLYITGVHLESSAALAATYVSVQLMVGGSGVETVLGQYLVPLSTASTVALGYRQIYPFIPVAGSARISAKTADSVGAKATLVTLEVIAQSNVVDDGIAVGTVTNLTNAPTAGDLTATMKASVTTAATAATPTAAAVTGAVGSVTAAVTLPAIPTNWITAAGTAADFNTEITTACTAATPTVTLGNGAHGGAAASLTLGGAAGLTATHIGNQTGNVSGSVGSVTADVGITQTGADKVWSTAARILTAGTNIVLAKGTGITGFNDIAATAIVSAGAITTSAGKVSGVILADTVTTYTGNTPQTGDTFSRVGVAGAGLTALGDTRIANLDAAISTRSTLAAGAAMTLTGLYDAAKTAATQASVNLIPTTAPDNSGIAAIKAKTDSLAFTVAGKVDANIKAVNDTTVNGAGTALSPWGP